MLDELPDDQRAALEAIVEGVAGWSWTKPPAGAALEAWRLDLDLDVVPKAEADRWLDGLNGHTPAIGPLEAVGLVERWRPGDGSEAATLSPLAAERLGVELVATAPQGLLPRWLRPGRIPPFVRASRSARVSNLEWPELEADWRDGPAEIATYPDWDGSPKPLALWGMLVSVDPRLGKGPARARAARPPKGKRARPTTP